MKTTLWHELKTLFWLQFKLTLAMFRSRRASDWFWLLRIVFVIFQTLISFPMLLAFGVGTGIGLAVLSAEAAFEVALLINTVLCLAWLMAPSMYSSSIMERFEMSRLFQHPMSFRGIVVGSTLMASLNITGLWTLPILLGEVIGLAWHKPLAAPLVLLGAIPTYTLLTLLGRIMDDAFDLVASDRRLRTAVLFVLTFPFMFLAFSQYFLQGMTDNYEKLPDFIPTSLATDLQAAQTTSEFIEILRPSRLLIWLPPGWGTAGMGKIVTGAWGQGLMFLVLSFGAVAGLLWLHAGITRRLMSGAALTVGVQRVRGQGLGFNWRPAGFWALFAKDWRYLWRSPLPRRMLFTACLMVASILFSLSSIPLEEISEDTQAIFVGFSIFLMLMLGLVLNAGLTANYFGAIDREGFGTLTTSISDWRWVLLSANLAMFVFSALINIVLLTLIVWIGKNWLLWPLLVYISLILQIGVTPAYTFAAIIGPFRAELKFSSQNRGGNLWSLLAWIVATPPVALLVLLPYFLWKPALFITLPLSLFYSVGLYWLTLKPLANLLLRRQHIVLERVTKD